MRIFGIRFSLKREPRPRRDIAVIVESLERHKTVIEAVLERLEEVEKKSEATRRKVYRDLEKTDGEQPAETIPTEQAIPSLKPGDPPPPGFQIGG